MPPRNYEPGGGQEVYGAAGYAMPAWTPPSRPADLGTVLARAVVPAGSPRAQAQGQQQQAPQPMTTQSLFGTVQLNPNQRNAPIYTALNLGGLFGGGGSGGNQSQPVAPAPTSTGKPTLRAPSGDDWTFDEQGNPAPNYPATSMTTDELASAIHKHNWFRNL